MWRGAESPSTGAISMKLLAHKRRSQVRFAANRRTHRVGTRTRSATRRFGRKSLGQASTSPRKQTPDAVKASGPARPVTFEVIAPSASLVCIAGNFNEWNPHASPLRSMPGGRWSVRLRLKPGRYEYRFLVDGVWKPDPQARQYVTDFCGGLNSVVVVE